MQIQENTEQASGRSYIDVGGMNINDWKERRRKLFGGSQNVSSGQLFTLSNGKSNSAFVGQLQIQGMRTASVSDIL